MNRPTFNQTVDVLVKAYLNGTLAHKLCTACAVGNIVAATMNTVPKPTGEDNMMEFDCWQYDNGVMASWYTLINDNFYNNESPEYAAAVEQVKATGYTTQELVDIERAFEHAPGDPSKDGSFFRGRCVDDTWMFNGLMAVVDVLAEIHGVDLEVKESAKLLFVKP